MASDLPFDRSIEEGVCFLEQNARILRSGLVESYNI